MRIANGDTVSFRDIGNVRHGCTMIVEATGTVNGDPIEQETADLDRFWPVFTERDHGREATTIFVNERNIIGVKHHSFRTVPDRDECESDTPQ